ncbi:hypothetical protein HMPREF3038_02005 [Akkermansia sp. KLE1797]|nr:hypothetical protein HMPREF3038_02005 [Akkermansia sp. KLE1797]KXU54727.1 hypothetical protein HMPREF3039_01200 [Akkermansia sp. KLE1798]KZA06071.1 hypothetical protein HMPREF1326_00335 [Akkermansia sp. KLE1605]
MYSQYSLRILNINIFLCSIILKFSINNQMARIHLRLCLLSLR